MFWYFIGMLFFGLSCTGLAVAITQGTPQTIGLWACAIVLNLVAATLWLRSVR